MLDRRLEMMEVEREVKSIRKRLCQAMEMAGQVGREGYETWWRKYCPAARLEGFRERVGP